MLLAFQPHPLTNTSSFKSYCALRKDISSALFHMYGRWNRSNALMILAQVLCNISFKLVCIFRVFFISHFSHTAYDSWIISQGGKWANRHFVIFFLIERPHLSSMPTFPPPYLMQRLFRTGLQHHRHHLMQLVSERRHSVAHSGCHGSQEVDQDPAGVRLRQGV